MSRLSARPGEDWVRVLLVEDELRLAENIASALREGPGYAVDVSHDGVEAVDLAKSGNYDLIVLDLMIPKLSGDEVVSQLRGHGSSTPVLVLTAVGEVSRIIGLLDKGADDYMTKPFDLGELIARTRALIRRGKGVGHPVLQFGNLRVHTGEQRVTYDDVRVELSPTEYRILEYLMFRPQIIVSKRELLEHLYDFTWAHHSNVIEAHVSNLRKKLRTCADHDLLQTLRGRGYRLAGI
ncbi:MAG TPA: response regulator transcription factor [Acidobacteriaceae bacterium]